MFELEPNREKPLIIDCHTHAWMPEDIPAVRKHSTLLDKNLESDSPHNWTPCFDISLDVLLEKEREAGIDRMVILPASSKPEHCRELTRWVAGLAEEFSQIIPFGSVHPYSDSVEDDVKAIADLGIKGVKLHSLVQMFDTASSELQKLYGLLEKADLVVLMDAMSLAGATAAKPELGPLLEMADRAGLENNPERIAETAIRFPGLKIIAAHLGCCHGWDLLDPLYDLDNVYFDLSYIHPLISKEKAFEIIRRKGAEKIVFGTDAPYRRPEESLSWFMELPLEDEERKTILGGAFMELLN